jgi:DNA-binding MarR family transcriptional regulator
VKIEKEIKQEKFKNPYQKAMVNLIFTSNWLNDKMKSSFKPYDLTSQQYNVLKILKGRYPDPAAAGDIKDVMLDKTPDLTRLIDRLIKKELVSRRTCEHNRRKVDILISEKGVALIEKIEVEFKGDKVMFDGLSSKEASALSDLLDKIRG